MEITRKDLILICNKFLNHEIGSEEIQNFASNAIFSDDADWDDEIISKTIFEWDNEEINFPINNVNIELWKKRLIGNEDELIKYNFWNSHIETQKEICQKADSLWKPINKKSKIGVSKNLTLDPLNGLRHNSENGTSGWFIWSGDYSENDDFFEPVCAEHLLQIRPEIIDYLGLDIGFRFQIDKKGYEDIWFDKNVSEI